MRKPVIGIDLGGTNMQVGVVARDSSILARAKHKTLADLGKTGVIERIVDSAREVCAEAGLRMTRIGALGIAAPGAIDIPRGIVLEAPNLKWVNVNLRMELKKRLGIPVILDNDVNAAVWGEFKLGAGRKVDDLLGVWIGTGVGGGLVLDGRLHHGPFFTAGEIGQTIIMPDGKRGSRTIEDFCSRTGMSQIIQRRLRKHPRSILHGLTDTVTRQTGSKGLAMAYRQKDELAMDIVNRAAHLLGIVIANMVTMLAIKRVVVGGGVTEQLREPFLKKVRASFTEHVFPDRCKKCEIVYTKLEENAGLLGAALLARDGN
jgi:glucokinase